MDSKPGEGRKNPGRDACGGMMGRCNQGKERSGYRSGCCALVRTNRVVAGCQSNTAILKDLAPYHFINDLLGQGGGARLACQQVQFRILRPLVGLVDPRKVLDLAG